MSAQRSFKTGPLLTKIRHTVDCDHGDGFECENATSVLIDRSVEDTFGTFKATLRERSWGFIKTKDGWKWYCPDHRTEALD